MTTAIGGESAANPPENQPHMPPGSPADTGAAAPRTLAQGGRDRLLTTIRAVSMMMVVLTHVAFSNVKPNATGIEPVADALPVDIFSWLIAWVAAFFATGGALSRHSGKTPLLRWWARRGPRLVAPYYVFIAIIIPIEFVLAYYEPLGICADFGIKQVVAHAVPPPAECTGMLGGPLWFLFVYVPLALFSPWLVKIYDSRLRIIAPAVAIGALLVLDLSVASGTIGQAATLGSSAFSAANALAYLAHLFLFWGLIYYAGFFYADGYLDNLGRKALYLALAFAALCAVMVLAGPWPGQVFGAWHRGGNQFPPTLAWGAAFLAWMFLLIWLRNPIEMLALRKIPGKIVDWFANRSLTILIWHMTAFTLLYWFVRSIGFLPTLDGLPVGVSRLIWTILVFAVTVPVVDLFYPVERWSDRAGKALERRYVSYKSKRNAPAQP